MSLSNKPIYIDAASFAQPRKSGIGHIAEGIAKALIKYVSDNGHSRLIYLIVPFNKAKYIKDFQKSGTRIKKIFLPARVFNLLLKFNLVPPLDIALGRGHYIFPNYRNWPLQSSKSFTYVHDISFLHFPEYTEPKNLAYMRSNIARWIKRSTFVITSSQYTKHEIETRLDISSEKVKVVHHGVDRNIFARQASDVYTGILANYGIKQGGFILCIGNIEPRKNIVRLIAAYRSLQDDLRASHPLLLIGGGGWLNENEQAAIQAAKREGYAILQPNRYVEDVDLPAFYSAASALIMPSRYEGFGVPPLQALSTGTPTIVANNSSLKELFGGVSIMVNAESEASIKEGMVAALTMSPTKKEQYKVKANKIANELSWDAAAKELMTMVENND